MRDEEKSTIHAEKGFAYLSDGLLDKAIEEFKLSLSNAPDNINAIINLGTALQQKGLIDEAITLLESVLKQGWVKNSEILGSLYYNLGNTYRDKKDEEKAKVEQKAIEQYKKAIENRPNHASSWYNLGQSYGALGKLDDAAKAYKRALEINPEHSEAKIRLDGLIELKDSGDYNQAIKMITSPTDEYENLLIEGKKYLFTGKFRSAIEQFKEALRLYPEEAGGYVSLFEAYFELMSSKDKFDSQSLQTNLELLEKAESLIISEKSKHSIDKYNGLSELHHLRARCYVMLDKFEQAVEEFQKALDIQPDKKESRRGLEQTKELVQISKPKSKGCFIATACYGTTMAEEVKILSSFRDKCIATNPIGRILIRFYYNHTPEVANFIIDKEYLKIFIKECLRPCIWIIRKIGR